LVEGFASQNFSFGGKIQNVETVVVVKRYLLFFDFSFLFFSLEPLDGFLIGKFKKKQRHVIYPMISIASFKTPSSDLKNKNKKIKNYNIRHWIRF
jgi:hypothetical protein